MKITLPHREVRLDTSLPFDERNKEINTILSEVIEFHAESMTVEEYFRYTWNKANTKVCMDIIGYYLTKGNAEGEDREVISNKKMIEMVKGSTRHTTFSGMGYENQVAYGLVDIEETY